MVVMLALCAAGITGAAAVRAQESTTDREAIQKGFDERVKAYMDLRSKLEQGLPSLNTPATSTATVDTREQMLSMRIRSARADAKPGDIFGSAAPYFRATIRRDTETRGTRDAYALMQEVPVQNPPAVNASYPEKAALATVPPLILVNLPRLPDGLEYRFMGRDLILRDRAANIIADFIAGAVPVVRR